MQDPIDSGRVASIPKFSPHRIVDAASGRFLSYVHQTIECLFLTTKHYPTGGDFRASEETDMYLVAVTLLFGTIPKASERVPMAKQDIHEKVAYMCNVFELIVRRSPRKLS